MNTDLLSVLLGFIEGFALIISPCILPILPVFLAGSMEGSKKRPLGIVTGFTLAFALVAWFSRQLVQYWGIDLNLIRHVSFAILLLLGLIMISSRLTNVFSRLTQRFAGLGGKLTARQNLKGGFGSGLFLGSLIAIVWTPCAGPVLATVIVQTVMQKNTTVSFFILLAFALGAAIPMFVIAFYGRKLISAFDFFKTHAEAFRKTAGAIIIASVAYLVYYETWSAPSNTIQSSIKTATFLQQGLWSPYPAPDIAGIDTWINSPPLTIKALKGKVVLVDFWTYSCINCIRSLPYLNNWYQKYHDKGFVIIGVHTPEFEFEKNPANVRSAVIKDGIHYPVALDNNYITWVNYANHYWPAHFLINRKGDVVYTHFGEGEYDITENNISYLLGINTLTVPATFGDAGFAFGLTPETYLGYERADSGPHLTQEKVAEYAFSSELPANAWELQGKWLVHSDKIVSAAANASLKIHFKAAKVYMVMGTGTGTPITVTVRLNGNPLIKNSGKDVSQGRIVVKNYTLYEVVLSPEMMDGILQITADKPGLEMYTFTFGY